ncbi:hypothetical protein TrRE_jg9764 [Triparma retinervis]|uniref:Bromo domain-containing protein n=1 Tax=Triparma retinervis TaxID=2557542 RepID=A0A9W7EGZ9_9STRA|nr:hypothetical protein TrRE_jg9764 [Triparma retinervis]
MDLGTVRDNLGGGNYDTVAAAANDVRQVFRNCCKYNDEGTDFYQLGESFSARFEDMYKRVSRSSAPSSSSSKVPPQSFASASYGRSGRGGLPSLEVRKGFSGNLFKITGDELGHVVTVLDQRCPGALTSVGGEDGEGTKGRGGRGGGDKDEEPNVEIVIDQIEEEVFWELKEFVDNKIERRKGSKRKR